VRNYTINDVWQMIFGMPSGQPLTTGTYVNATRYPSQSSTAPGLDFSKHGSGNNELSGKFTILEVIVSNGALLSFAADFTQYDGKALASWNYGSIRYNSSIPLNTLPPEPIKPISIACTNAFGPVVMIWGYGYSSACYASGGAGPYTWSVSNLPPGLLARASSYYGPDSIEISGSPNPLGPFDYTVTATDSNGDTASQNFSGTATRPDCLPFNTDRGFPQPFNIGSSGGGSIMSISSLSNSCPWTLTADIPGITFSPSSGVTHGPDRSENVILNVSPNTGSAPLEGTVFLTEGGKVVQRYPIVVNSSSCGYTVDPPSGRFGPQGGSGTFTVTTSPGSCQPFRVGYSSWLSAGDGVYYYEIPPNAGAAKSGAFQFGPSYSEAAASFTWEQEAGDESLLMNCYKPGPNKIDSTVAICVAAGGTPPYLWNIIAGTVPGDDMEISTDGSIVRLGKPQEAGPYEFTIQVTDSAASSFGIATYTITGTVPPRPPQFNCSENIGPARIATTYSTVCVPHNGTPPYQWSVSEGELPAGLALTYLDDGVAVISGVPSSAGDYSYTLQLTDSFNPIPRTSADLFNGTIAQSDSEPPPFALDLECTIRNATFTAGIPIVPIGCSVSGGTQPYTWSFHSGVLPAGLTLSSTTGSPIIIAGTPTEASYNGSFDSIIKVIDSSSTPLSSISSLRLYVYSSGPDFSCSPAAGQVGRLYSASCTGSYTTGQLGLWISAGQLPPGLVLTSRGIAGTPTTQGIYAFTISLQNGLYPTPSHSFEIAVESGSAAISITTNPAGRSFTVDGTTYTNSQTFSWTAGSSHAISANTLQILGGVCYVFANWSDGAANSHSITVSAEATTYTANFTTQYRLTTSVSPQGGGSISISPIPASGYYPSGSTVQLSATANRGYSFAGWEGDVVGTTNPLIVTMPAPRNVMASFRKASTLLPRVPSRSPSRAPLRRDQR
jgi:hypothetical protein